MKIFRIIATAVMLFVGGGGFALADTMTPPDILVRDTFNEVMTIVNNDKDVQTDRQKLRGLVEAKIVPHFNFTHTMRLAMGKNWRKATPEQQAILVREFQALLVHTYSNVLLEFKDRKFTVKAVVSKGDPNTPFLKGDDVIIKGEIDQPNDEPILVEYSMEKTPDGWKVYDVFVEGLSLVTIYRNNFTEEVNHSGIDGLIKVLIEKNQRLAAGQI